MSSFRIDMLRELSQIIFPTVSVSMTLRGGGGGGVGGGGRGSWEILKFLLSIL